VKCPYCGYENAPDSKSCGRCAAAIPGSEGFLPPTMEMKQPLCELTTGTTFVHRYQVIEELGRGGMGRVYKVFDAEVREKLALKLLNPDIASEESVVDRFRRELRLARTVSHRYICRMHDLGRDEETGTYYLTMEYVPGEDLKSLIHRLGALPVGKTVAIARQVVEGLAEAHRQGIIHRDLKPQNIMIDREGEARIMDFGIARSVKAKGITGAGVMIGTPEYMSPEQVEGKDVDARSDVYALGLVIFEMATGRPPFAGETALSIAVKQKSEAPPDPRSLNPQIPDDLGRLILKCLEKAKEKRFADAGELEKELARIEKTLPSTPTPLRLHRAPTSKEFTVRLPSKKIWIPAVVLLLILGAFVAWQFVPEAESAKRPVAVLGFKNQTNDPSLDYLRETIPNLLITSLEQSKFLRVASWQRLKDLLRLEGREDEALFDEEACFAACLHGGIETAVVGFFSKAGDTFVSDVKVLDLRTRDVLKSVSARGEGVNSILKSQVDDLSRAVSRGIGHPVLKVEMPGARVADLTTDSLEAYNYFLRGRDEADKLMATEAKKLLDKAIAIDPTFALAYRYLSKAENYLIDWKARDEALVKAMEYSGKASEKERLYIEAAYAAGIEKNQEKKRRLLEELTEKYPQEKLAFYELGSQYYELHRNEEAVRTLERVIALDPKFGPAFNITGYSYTMLGDFPKAEAAFRGYIAAQPGDPNPLDSLGEFYVQAGRLDEAAAAFEEALELEPDFVFSMRGLAYVSALKEEYPEAFGWLEKNIDGASESGKIEGRWLVGIFDMLVGRFDKSLAEMLELKRICAAAGQEMLVAYTEWASGLLYAERGRFDEARRALTDCRDYFLRTDPARKNDWAIEYLLNMSFVDLKEGRSAEARGRVAKIVSLLPSSSESADFDSYAFKCRLVDAEVSLAEGATDEAIAAMKDTVLEPLPSLNTDQLSKYNIPLEKDVLARAYWKKGDLAAAESVYRKLMTFDPIDRVRYFIHPLYHFRLGRILEEKGDKSGAAAEYRKFLVYWKDSDPERPEPAEARRRLAGLPPYPVS
jgi:serine/threonine protein kinase/Flp pilus assembly protein TadD